LDNTIPTLFPSSLLGNGQVLTAGVYAIGSATTLNLDLTLNAEGDSNAVFIFQIEGPLSTNADSKIKLTNGAKACNVFWKIEGLVDMASGTSFKGTIIANNAAINLNTGDTLEGRALTTAGAITIDGTFAYIPIGCGSEFLTGPTAPNLGKAACFAIFSSTGAVSNTGVSTVIGDIGSNNGAATAFDPLFVSGEIHEIPDVTTGECAADLLVAYNYLNTLTYDIELLYPAQFGGNLLLTPHTYLLNAAVTFTDSLYLDARGNEDAVFVLQVNGAFSTSTYSKVLLINGAKAKKVYWKIEGAVSINDYSTFCGTIIANNSALGAINTGVFLYGRALTTNGALSVNAASIVVTDIPATCNQIVSISENDAVNSEITIYPNPFSENITLNVNDFSNLKNVSLKITDILGKEVLLKTIQEQTTLIEMNALKTGIYFYEIKSYNSFLKSGKLISQP
jgi:hypothetical protein